jgi:hypothetical protein
MADPLPKYARVDTQNPEAFAMCDRCGFWRNRSDLVWQYEWAGMQLYSKGTLVCFDRCYDIPQEQLRTIILPPDPPPIVNARVPNFDYEEQTVKIYQFASGITNGDQLPPWGAGPQLEKCNQSGAQTFVLQYLTSS